MIIHCWLGLVRLWSELRRVTSSLVETSRACCAGLRSRRLALSWLLLSSLSSALLWFFMPHYGEMGRAGTTWLAILRADNWALLVLFAVLAMRPRPSR